MINVNKFSEQFLNIKTNFKEYEFKIFQTLSIAKNLSFYWNDGYTKAFFSEINKEIHSANDLIDSIYRLCSLFSFVQVVYNDVHSKQAEFLGIYSSVINPNDFIIQNKDDSEMATKKRYLYNKVINIEENISDVIFQISIPYIKKISFEDLSTENSNKDFVGMLDEIENEINRLGINVQDMFNVSDKLKKSLYDILAYYNCKNGNSVEKIVEDIEDGINTLNTNLKNAFEYVYNRKKGYKELFDEFSEEVKFDN